MSRRLVQCVSVALAVLCGVSTTTEAGLIADRLRDRLASRGVHGQHSGRLSALRNRSATEKSGERVTLNGREVAIWRPSGTERHPLILFSHGFNGCNTQSTFLMEALAANGFLVAAPNHKDAKCGRAGFGRPEESFRNADAWTEKTYLDRRDDMDAVIQGLQENAEWNDQIDWHRIGLAGHSLGGYTVLALGGGWESWRMRGVKAVLAMSPYCKPFSEQHTLGDVFLPVMYQGGTRDIGITPSVRRPGGCYDQVPGPAIFVEFNGAGHLAWADRQATFHNSIVYYGVAFMDQYVKGDTSDDLSERLSDVSDLRMK